MPHAPRLPRQVPPPEEDELLEAGYPPALAKSEAGGKGFLLTEELLCGLWNWHGWYKEYWRGPEWHAERDSGSVNGGDHRFFWGRSEESDNGRGGGKGGGYVKHFGIGGGEGGLEPWGGRKSDSEEREWWGRKWGTGRKEEEEGDVEQGDDLLFDEDELTRILRRGCDTVE